MVANISWGDFKKLEPELAAFGESLLRIRPAYLATVRRNGAPRVHPVTPIFASSALYMFMEPRSPKGRDLRERGWYSLHNGVPDDHGSGGEFFITGMGFPVTDTHLREIATDAASYEPSKNYVLFELRLASARCNGYGDVPLPTNRRWSVT